ncbi:MAG: hypothetical protein HY812_00030 [Planctomycetes bacterium]|nr:hypothetical protein [Planctomycetota bacterium]
MKRLRVYLDTSVLGGCFDREFSKWSNALMTDFREARFSMVVSAVTLAEVSSAPQHVRNLLDGFLEAALVVPVTDEAIEVLSAYEARRVLAPRFRNDMLHIAIATVAEVDAVVSWNFRHIVRLDKIRLFNAVNMELGYKPLTICSPREVATHERED